MAELVMKALNGPYEVTAGAKATDHQGAEYKTPGDAVCLCRSAQSGKKPFCDGTHNRVGFKDEETTP